MNNAEKFVKNELALLNKAEPDSLVPPFSKEIIALCKTFSNSGQSGWAALFKDEIDSREHYPNAIFWVNTDYTFSGTVYMDRERTSVIGSSQYVRFPFRPKTFFIDVINIPIDEKEAENNVINYTKDLDGQCHYTIVKDINQLNKVFEYYDKRNRNEKVI